MHWKFVIKCLSPVVSKICIYEYYIYFIIVILFSLSGVFLFLSLTIVFVELIVCYFRKKRKHSQSNVTFECASTFYKDTDPQEQAQDLSSVNPQYENVPAPPQSVLSMKECAAYGVIEGTSRF